jgi:hypothetical protein
MHTSHPTPHTAYRIPLCIFFILFTGNTFAQRLEIHANKDFSTNEIATKAWGVGAAVDLDQFVKNVIFRANFNWAIHRPNGDVVHHNYQRFTGGVSALYSLKIKDKISIQGGVELSYTFLRHSYIYSYEPTPDDTTKARTLTVLHTGNFIGIAPHIGVRYELGKRMSAVLNFIPTYLIMVGNKSSAPSVASEYQKGFWLFPIQLGLSYQLYK